MGEILQARLAELPQVRSVRGVGLMVAAEVDAKAPDVARRALMEEHLVVNATGPTTLRFVPPLVITEAEVDEALTRLARVLPA